MNKCEICKQEITVRTENREDIEGMGYEWDYEDGHKEDCRYYKREI